jgi:hypothetical protein
VSFHAAADGLSCISAGDEFKPAGRSQRKRGSFGAPLVVRIMLEPKLGGMGGQEKEPRFRGAQFGVARKVLPCPHANSRRLPTRRLPTLGKILSETCQFEANYFRSGAFISMERI